MGRELVGIVPAVHGVILDAEHGGVGADEVLESSQLVGGVDGGLVGTLRHREPGAQNGLVVGPHGRQLGMGLVEHAHGDAVALPVCSYLVRTIHSLFAHVIYILSEFLLLFMVVSHL